MLKRPAQRSIVRRVLCALLASQARSLHAAALHTGSPGCIALIAQPLLPRSGAEGDWHRPYRGKKHIR